MATQSLKCFYVPTKLLCISFVDLSDSESRLQRIHTLVDTLPKANQDTLERLVFHLAR